MSTIVHLRESFARRRSEVPRDAELKARLLQLHALGRTARDDMQTARQLEIALEGLALAEEQDDPTLASLIESHAGLAGDACSSLNEHRRGLALTERARDQIERMAPGSLSDHRARMHVARAIEMAGDPGDAYHRYMGLYFDLRRVRAVREELQQVASLQALQGVHSAAKRAGSREGREFAERATRLGEHLANGLERVSSHTVAHYRQREGFTLSWLDLGAGDATARLTWAAGHRGTRGRDLNALRTIEGELAHLGGDRARAVSYFKAAAAAFDATCPRKAASLRLMMAQRDLAAL